METSTKERLNDALRRASRTAFRNFRLRKTRVDSSAFKDFRRAVVNAIKETGTSGLFTFVAGELDGKIYLIGAGSPTARMALANIWVYYPVRSFNTSEELNAYLKSAQNLSPDELIAENLMFF